MNNILPNFLIVGAAKSGTTSIFNYLNQHQEIYIPERKECRFLSGMSGKTKGPGADFVNDVIPSLEEYEKLFAPGKGIKARGDVSVEYLYYYKKTIENINKYLDPNTKIIIFLRNPIDRAYSNYMHHIRISTENLSFEEALAQESERKANNWSYAFRYFEVGLYYEQVQAYLNSFKNVKIFIYEEDFKNQSTLLKAIFDFLEVETDFEANTEEKFNMTGVPKTSWYYSLLFKNKSFKKTIRPVAQLLYSDTKIQKIKRGMLQKKLKRVPMTGETRMALKQRYREDILKLETLLHKDLSSWLN